METLQLIGFSGLSYVNLNSISANQKEQNYLIGSLLLSTGFLFRTYEFYQTNRLLKSNLSKNKLPITKDHLSKGHLFLFLFYLISFIHPINRRHTPLNILAVIGHGLLIKKNIYNGYGLLILAIYYMIQIQENITKDDNNSRIRAISAMCILTYYLEELKKINLIKRM